MSRTTVVAALAFTTLLTFNHANAQLDTLRANDAAIAADTVAASVSGVVDTSVVASADTVEAVAKGGSAILAEAARWWDAFSPLDLSLVFLFLVATVIVWRGITILRPRVEVKLDSLARAGRIKPLIVRNHILVRARTWTTVADVTLRVLRFFVILALFYLALITAVGAARPEEAASFGEIVRGLLVAAFALFLARSANRSWPVLYERARSWEGTHIGEIRFGRFVLATVGEATQMVINVLVTLRILFVLVVTYLILSYLLGVFGIDEGTIIANAVGGLFVAVFVVTIYVLLNRVFPWVYRRVDHWEESWIRDLRIGGWEILSAAQIADLLMIALEGLRLAIGFVFFIWLAGHVLDLVPFIAGWDYNTLLTSLLGAALLTVFMIVVIRAIIMLYHTFVARVREWKGTLIKTVRVKRAELITQERLGELLEGAIRIVYLVLIVSLVYTWLTSVFSMFTLTEHWGDQLAAYVLNPATSIVMAFVNYLPNLFTIIVIVIVARYLLKFVHWFFQEVGRGNIPLGGFYTDWAAPTYNIVRFLILAFVAIIIFPYLPGSDSPAFGGISVFLGLMLSLGSASAIANVVSGVVLTYMRAFKVGDRVKIADTIGDVTEKTLLVTRVRTVKNVDITIPNAMVLGSHITNFSSSAVESGLVLHTTVTIGYDVPWRKVHELLVEAALRTKGVHKEPAPFVLQTGLQDYYPAYELNVYTEEPNRMARIYSELHGNIQDVFNEAGVEILSPAYSAIRDGNASTTPSDYLPKEYDAPPFKIRTVTDLLTQHQTVKKAPSEKTPGE